jgi:NAD(P)-dependent dehydrogenase (short-subunit alcohol dehydrogenase family)
MRLQGKTAIIIGAGQAEGETLGNGRATALRFAQEGAKVMAADLNLASAEETASMIRENSGECIPFKVDVTKEDTLNAAIAAAKQRWGRIDILHYNVGTAVGGGDTELLDFTEEIFDRMFSVNLRGAIMACKHVIPIMREQQGGAINMISSIAVYMNQPQVAYKATKAGMLAFTRQLAIQNAEYGIRANAILPGVIETPMAIERRMRLTGKSHARIVAEEDAHVPLRHKMGTAWDVANAALFLASDEANYITGAELCVDGGCTLNTCFCQAPSK